MRTGKKYPQDSFRADTWVKAYETTLTGTATSITISGLDGNTDEEWILETRIVNSYNGGLSYTYRFNNDSDVNYGEQRIIGNNAVVIAEQDVGVTQVIFGGVGAQNELFLSEVLIYAKSGYVRTSIGNFSANILGTTVGRIFLNGCSWNNSVDNITDITLTGTQANGYGIGSYICLWKKVAR